MKDFTKTIDHTVFNFKAIQEREEDVFLVSAGDQNFRMINDDEGIWFIWQQVPSWIKLLEEELGDAIDEQYANSHAGD